MLRLVMIGLMLLMTCLNLACQTVNLPKMKDHERCIISLKFERCRCHMYRVSPETVGRVSDSYDKPLRDCDNLVGFKPSVWVDYVLFLEEVFQAVEDANQMSGPRPDLENEVDILLFVGEISLP